MQEEEINTRSATAMITQYTARTDAAFAKLNELQDAFGPISDEWQSARKAYLHSRSNRNYVRYNEANKAFDAAYDIITAQHEIVAEAQDVDAAEQAELAAEADRAASPSFSF